MAKNNILGLVIHSVICKDVNRKLRKTTAGICLLIYAFCSVFGQAVHHSQCVVTNEDEGVREVVCDCCFHATRGASTKHSLTKNDGTNAGDQRPVENRPSHDSSSCPICQTLAIAAGSVGLGSELQTVDCLPEHVAEVSVQIVFKDRRHADARGPPA